MLLRLWREEDAAVLSAELLLILTIVVVGLVVGMGRLRGAVTHELVDLSNAVGSLNQSFLVPSMEICACRVFVAGSGFNDRTDECDCSQVDTCGVVKDHNGDVVKSIIQNSQG